MSNSRSPFQITRTSGPPPGPDGALPWSVSATKAFPPVLRSHIQLRSTDTWVLKSVVAPQSRWKTTALSRPFGESISTRRSLPHRLQPPTDTTNTRMATGPIRIPMSRSHRGAANVVFSCGPERRGPSLSPGHLVRWRSRQRELSIQHTRAETTVNPPISNRAL